MVEIKISLQREEVEDEKNNQRCGRKRKEVHSAL